jgi:hypothetical protein
MLRMRMAMFFCIALFLSAAIPASAGNSINPEADVQSSDQSIRQKVFQVFRNGSKLGRHIVSFRQMGDMLRVETDIKFKVKVAFVTLFNYKHKNTAYWRNDELVSMQSVSDDNGNERELNVSRDAAGLHIKGSKFDGLVEGLIMPTTYWNQATSETSQLFNTQNGKLMSINVEQVGMERIEAGGREIDAMKYAISGDLDKEIWYDENGDWVKSTFSARGQNIEYVLLDDRSMPVDQANLSP